ncbi:MAG TPA: adenylate/guanylate cyclase domain-containing protein [Solirubrobacterales bacterium]|jgi:adenylate cyclase|nr:adenylate/guanylate cyclase domain-containing protein [Solirubrobacterales bacterium]
MPEPGKDDGERKQVTVLFADVSGSMDLAEGQDPEEWRKIMQRFFAILTAAVDRFEGTVDKFTGDGIMAVFGAPVAHEDHARRACYAALQMLDDVAGYAAELRRGSGLNFSTRIGINSGEVVAGGIGAGGTGEYTAIGHTVGLAQRMEALAEPSKAYLTESTAELAHGFMRLEDLGQFEIKGASRPVRVFELAGVGAARSRLDLSRERGFSSFVGRDEEMAVLEGALERAENSEGAAIGIVAEPGIGKSRLCHEFAERCRERGIEVFECQAQAHGRSIPFMPVLQMLRSYFGIADGDSERIVREKIAGRALLLDPDFAEDLPLLFDFLGVPDPDRPLAQLSAEARHRSLRGVVCRLVRAPNRRNSIVALIEDLHWMDEGSANLLGELISAVEGTKTLAVVNFRPEYEAEWSGAATYRGISLEPLGPDDSHELLRDLAGADPSLDGLGDLVHERTAGNPFFIEEIVRGLAESGHLAGERGAYRLARPVEDTGVPASVQTVLAARIDRLDPTAKQLLQAASATSKEISERALGLISGLEDDEGYRAALCELTEGGFLYETEIYPERIFAFRHPLTREVAYGTQLNEQRAVTHAATAHALIELNPDRLDELAALIASHMEAGGETLEAARWFARAAHWAGHSRPQDATRMWRKVMELVSGLDENEETAALAVLSRLLQLDYAWRLGMEKETADVLAGEAQEIAEKIGDMRSLALLKLLTAARPGVANEASKWIAAAEESIRLADEAGEIHLRVAIRGVGCYAHMCAGDLDLVENTVDEILELGGGDPTVGAGIVIGCPPAWALMARSVALKERGRLDEAEQVAEESLRLAVAYGDPETESWSRGNKATLLAERGEIEAAMALARRNCELTDQLGDVFSRSLALTSFAFVQLAAGDFDSALETIELSDRTYREAMNAGGEGEAWRGTLRARALLGAGRVEEALAQAEEATGTSRERGMYWQLPGALLTLAQARVAAGTSGAKEALAEASAICERLDHRTTLSKIEAERAALSTA